MRALVSIVISIAGVAALAALVGFWVLSSGKLKLSMEELEQRYAVAESKFADIDGIRVHYMDQCKGPVVVLMHASSMNLFTWDSLAEALCSQYRVIRMDRLVSGLTGPDPKKRYSVEGEMAMLDGLLAQLGVEEFHLIATSSAGTVGFRFTAENPQRVRSLILVNSAGLPRTAATNPNRSRGNVFQQWFDKYHRTKSFWRKQLSKNFVLPNKPPSWLLDMVYDTARRDTLREEVLLYLKNYRTGDPEKVLGQITAPVMVMWGMENATVMHLEADVIAHWLVNAKVSKKKYQDVAHYLYLEIPDQFEADVLAFLQQQTEPSVSAEQSSVETIISGKSVCRDTKNGNQVCGVDHWSMYVHRDGSRYLHVASDKFAGKNARHVVITVDADNEVSEAYVSASLGGKFKGSSYVVLRDGKAFIAADNSNFSDQAADVRLEVIEQPGESVSIGTGPASADGVHFADFVAGATVHDNSVYWVGGSFGDMFGRFFDGSNERLGTEPFILADGTEVTATHYRMKTGSEIWLLEPYGVLLRIKLAFGAVEGQVYETTELSISQQSF